MIPCVRFLLMAVFPLLLVLAPGEKAWGFQRKARCTVRFFLETDGSRSGPFAVPVVLHHPTRDSFVESVASISERQVRSVTCYPAQDGSWGCLFQLDESGRLVLQNISSANRGRTLVAHVGNAKVSRQVQEIYIDRVVADGLLAIPRGLTYVETLLLQKHFPELKTANASSGGNRE